jgi:A/G-specific adenine glycosylase
VRAAILRWYLANRRDLPWRRSRDPYAIWVSEIMLQQTRVETVRPYYERFLDRFPTVESLARSRESAVLAAWSGLGYYRRARNLRAAASLVVREHGGRLPADVDALRSLPGVGEYTAAAIASVAFDQRTAAVDGNVIRVIARIEGLRGARDDAALKRAVSERAAALVRGPRPGDWTQALMELGALVCLPRDPRCEICPAASACAARASGIAGRIPGAARVKAPRTGRRVLLVARSRGRVLLVPDGADKGAAWTLPEAPVAARGGAGRAARATARRHGLPADAVRGPLAEFRHRTFSHDLIFEIWEADGKGPTRKSGGRAAHRWLLQRALEKLPLRAPTLKALKRLKQ